MLLFIKGVASSRLLNSPNQDAQQLQMIFSKIVNMSFSCKRSKKIAFYFHFFTFTKNHACVETVLFVTGSASSSGLLKGLQCVD